MTDIQISKEAIERRNYWISEIVRLSGNFGQDSSRVEQELTQEIETNGAKAVLDHLRLCGAIPESYGHDTSEEKLYSKYTDALLAVAFRAVGLNSIVLSERADAADVEVVADGFTFVADAKAFRLSRTAKNQKDFKVQAMDGWRRNKNYAVVVSPLYQMPSRTSQIYLQAITSDVCLLSYSHIAVLLNFRLEKGEKAAEKILKSVFECVSTMNPSKAAVDYWAVINKAFLDADPLIKELWAMEKSANLEAVKCSKDEALTYLSQERENIMRLSHDEAIKRLLVTSKIENKINVISGISDNNLLNR
jgi:hypothetical protein